IEPARRRQGGEIKCGRRLSTNDDGTFLNRRPAPERLPRVLWFVDARPCYRRSERYAAVTQGGRLAGDCGRGRPLVRGGDGAGGLGPRRRVVAEPIDQRYTARDRLQRQLAAPRGRRRTDRIERGRGRGRTRTARIRRRRRRRAQRRLVSDRPRELHG